MAAVTIRNLSDETHRALKVRAAHNNRSTEAEIRAILEAAVRPGERVLLGSALNAIGRKAGITKEEIEAIVKAQLHRLMPSEIPRKPLVDFLEGLHAPDLDLAREPDTGREIDF